MNKRYMLAAVAALAATPFMIGRPEAAGREGPSATFTVPRGVKKIRVRSYRDGRKVIDTAMNVQPGQTFTIDAV